jgi:hypothetical protein
VTITYYKGLKATTASLHRKVDEVQADAHVAGLKHMRPAVELNEALSVALGLEGSAEKESNSPCRKRSLNLQQQGLHVNLWAS